MKHLKLFFALFAMLALGVGNAWAQTVTWEKATSIAAGDVVALVCESKTMELSSISTTSTKYGIGTAYTSTPAGLYELTVEEGSSTGTFSFKNGSTYLNWFSGNSLSTGSSKNDNTSWKVTFSNGNLTIVNAKDNTRKLGWNASSPRFACYTSNQTAVQLYKKVTSNDVIVKTLKSIEVTPKTINYETGDVFKFDGTCTATYSVTKNEETQPDETAVVTPTTVSTPDMSTAGTKEITVTYTEDGVTVTDTYEINVTENVVTPGTSTGNLNNVFFGCAVGNNATEQSGKFDDVLVVAGCKSSASSKTYYAAGHVRFYADSYLTLSVPTGYVIKSIIFTADGTWSGSITASAGTYDNNSKTWTGNAQEVKFSFAAQNRIKSVEVTYAADVKYALNITTPSNGTLVVKDGSAVLADGAQVYEGTKLVVTPTPNPDYVFESLTVGGTLVELAVDGTYTFTMPANDVTVTATFKVNEAPDATLVLSKNGDISDKIEGKQGDVVTLPSFESDCSKAFVGWSENSNCTTEPEYKAGDSYELKHEGNKTIYAVYADGEGGGSFTITKTMSEIVSTNGYTVSSGNTATCYTSLTLDENITLSTTGQANCGSFWSDPREWRLYQNKSGNAIVTAANGYTLSSVKFTFTISNTGVLLNNGATIVSNTAVTASGTSATYLVGNSGTATNGQVRITAIEVSYSKEGEYSNYSTTCVAALDEPVFSVEGGENEAKTITLTATEGTIYYTLDGTTPTASSEKYTTPIVLDECGETTIKAIAISAESKSPVVSATYTINLPITNTAATAYTPAEAIAIIDGACDKSEEVYVKGVVVSTSEFNATYGNYDIIVKAVDDNSATPTTFTFYHMYKAASNTKFIESDEVIGVGDIITAKGKLTKFYSTYKFEAGCYMVERLAFTDPKTDISNTEETAYTVDKAFELISDIKSDLDKEVYVKGIVAVASTQLYEEKYLTYSISDNGQNTGNVLKVYDGLDIGGVAFTNKDDVKVGDYVVVKGKLFNYGGTYEINKDNQLVQHVKAATITIADITMEVKEVKTISATVEPAEAVVTYTIKENAANAISLSGNTITALAVGTATITATVAEGATYMGNSVDFTVTVTPESTSDEVVILAEYNGNWYALQAAEGTGSNSLAALEVTYFDGILYNVADKESITWTRTVVGNQVTFKNGENYLTGGTGTGLSLANASFEWTYKIEDGQDTYIYEYEDKGSIKSRTFLFYKDGYFKNYATSNAKPTETNYSGYPVVTAPVYDTAIEIGSGDNSTVIAANQGQIVKVIVDRAFEAGDEWYTLCVPFNMPASLIGTAYQLSGLVQKGTDYVEVNLAAKPNIEAGKPYLVKPNVTVNKFVVQNVTIVNTTGESIAKSIEGLSVTMQGVINGDGTTDGLYWVGNYGYLYNDPASKLGLRTYFNITTSSGIAPRMRVVAGENVETGVEDLFKTDAPVKVIENGQLIIIRDGVKYNVQGQKL